MYPDWFNTIDNKIVFEQSCKRCGSAYSLIGEGKGKHIAKFECKECGAFNGWMSKALYYLYECYKSETPAETYILKMQEARHCLDKAEDESNWIETKVAKKNIDILLMYKDMIDGIIHFD